MHNWDASRQPTDYFGSWNPSRVNGGGWSNNNWNVMWVYLPHNSDGCTASRCRRRAGTAHSTRRGRRRDRRTEGRTAPPEAPPARSTCRGSTSTWTACTPNVTVHYSTPTLTHSPSYLVARPRGSSGIELIRTRPRDHPQDMHKWEIYGYPPGHPPQCSPSLVDYV